MGCYPSVVVASNGGGLEGGSFFLAVRKREPQLNLLVKEGGLAGSVASGCRRNPSVDGRQTPRPPFPFSMD